MKIYQIRELTNEDLKMTLKDNYEALENLRFQHSTGQVENYKALANTQRDIAKIQTVIKEREKGINLNLTKVNK